MPRPIDRTTFGKKRHYGPRRARRLLEKPSGRFPGSTNSQFPTYPKVVGLLPRHFPQDVTEAHPIELADGTGRQPTDGAVQVIEFPEDTTVEPPLQIVPVGDIERPPTFLTSVRYLSNVRLELLVRRDQRLRSKAKRFAFCIGNEHRKRIRVDTVTAHSARPRLDEGSTAAAHRIENQTALWYVGDVQQRANQLRKELSAVFVQPVRPISQTSLPGKVARHPPAYGFRQLARRCAVASDDRRSLRSNLRCKSVCLVAYELPIGQRLAEPRRIARRGDGKRQRRRVIAVDGNDRCLGQRPQFLQGELSFEWLNVFLHPARQLAHGNAIPS